MHSIDERLRESLRYDLNETEDKSSIAEVARSTGGSSDGSTGGSADISTDASLGGSTGGSAERLACDFMLPLLNRRVLAHMSSAKRALEQLQLKPDLVEKLRRESARWRKVSQGHQQVLVAFRRAQMACEHIVRTWEDQRDQAFKGANCKLDASAAASPAASQQLLEETITGLERIVNDCSDLVHEVGEFLRVSDESFDVIDICFNDADDSATQLHIHDFCKPQQDQWRSRGVETNGQSSEDHWLPILLLATLMLLVLIFYLVPRQTSLEQFQIVIV